MSVDVTNTGSVAGKEVVQLYVRDHESTVFRPIRELKGFEKIFLAPGETKTVSFTLDKRAFAYWNVKLHDWHVETGAFSIDVGHSSREILCSADVLVKSTVEIPEKFDVNSIFLDLQKSTKAMQVLAPIMQQVMQNMGMGNEGHSEAAESAISKEMINAMIRYLPLRSIASFSGGALSFDQLAAMVETINKD